ncbi:MAG: hypothetical protein AB8B74_11350 [Crocinitomicaceae bacterium]
MKKIFFIPAFLLLIISCKKEGCTDPTALNYNVEAKKDDNSCTYEEVIKDYKSDVIFYWDQAVSNYLFDEDYYSVYIYIDETLMSSVGHQNYWNGSITCGDDGVERYEIDLKTEKEKTVDYKVVDVGSGDVIWSGTANLSGEECTFVKLVE